MIEAFIRALDARWQVDLEVPISRPSRGVIDAVLLTDRRSHVSVAVEAQSQLRRLEQQVRWIAEKADGLTQRYAREGFAPGDRLVSRLLVLRSTAATREIAQRYKAILAAAYPAHAADIARALSSGVAPWPGSGIVWMRVDGGTATLMSFPPRGVDLGR